MGHPYNNGSLEPFEFRTAFYLLVHFRHNDLDMTRENT
jgi:hypothetical protein